MKKRGIDNYIFIIVFFIIVSSAVVGGIGPIDVGELSCSQIVNFYDYRSAPTIYGDKIVWSDFRNKNYDVYMYDLSTDTERQITDNLYNQSYPEIYGDKIVWQEYKDGNYDIYAYDLAADTEILVTTVSSVSSKYKIKPSIYSDKIVWHELDGIHMYDLSTDTETQITDNPFASSGFITQSYPAIYGDKIVWYDSRTLMSGSIYMYDLSTDTERKLKNSYIYSDKLSVYGDKVVWNTFLGNSFVIFMYDLVDNKERIIESSELPSINPDIYGDKIVWQEYKDGNYDIYMCDLTKDGLDGGCRSKDTKTRITAAENNQQDPAIYGDKIVWRDSRFNYRPGEHYLSSYFNIYMYDLVTDIETQITDDFLSCPVVYTSCIDCSAVGCTSTDCHDIGDCYWVDTILGGECKDILVASSCNDFNDDKIACENNDLHGLGCVYNDVDDVCEKSLIQCGNDVKEIGENCLTCQEDAGCPDQYGNFCQFDGGCGLTYDLNTICDNDFKCESGEMCGCSDCNGMQAGCLLGYVCDDATVMGSGLGCIEDNRDYSKMNCGDINSVSVGCPSVNLDTNEPQFCVSTWNVGLPYIQTISTLDTSMCCLTGNCGTVKTDSLSGRITLYERGNCVPVGEGIEGTVAVTTTVYLDEQVVDQPTTNYESCVISKKTRLPFFGLSGIVITLSILIGFYLSRFNKR